MTPEELTADRKAVVKIVNRLRKKANMGSTSRLKKGVPSHRCACTVAMSLKGTGITGVDYSKGEVYVTYGSAEGLPRPVSITMFLSGVDEGLLARFLKNFDNGLYPSLEI